MPRVRVSRPQRHQPDAAGGARCHGRGLACGRQSVVGASCRPRGAGPRRRRAPAGGGAGRRVAGRSGLHVRRHRGQQHGAWRAAGRKRVLVSAIEHESVLKAVPGAEIDSGRSRWRRRSRRARADAGRPAEPALVSVMFANNETGVIQPVAEVVRLARAAGALVHCDAVQARRQGAGRSAWSRRRLPQPVRPQARRPDRASARWSCAPARRSPPTGGAAGRNPIVAPARRTSPASPASAPRAEASRDGLGRRRPCATGSKPALRAIAPGATVYGAAAPRLANTTCISMPGVKAETQVMALDLAGVCVSAGAACSSGKVHPVGGAVGHGRRSLPKPRRDQNKLAAGTRFPGILIA